MTRHTYIPAIDGLRAIAVLAVIAFHLDAQLLPGGFVGVDIFFVISGYVVARSLVAHAHEGFGEFLIGFYSRRIRRILPALVLCLLVTVVFTVLLIPDSWLASTIEQTALFAFFGMSNFALVWFQDGYFSPRAEFNPFVHTWSLSVEEQFYLVFPFLIYFWFKSKADARDSVKVLNALMLPLLGLASLIVAATVTHARADWSFYMLPSRFWELAAGVVLFQWQHKGWMPNLRSPLVKSGVMLVGFAFIAWGLIAADAQAFPYPWAGVPVIGTFLLLWSVSSTGAQSPLAGCLKHRLVIYIGKISYSLYLWHWPVFVLMRWTVGLESLWLKAIALFVTFALAIISYVVVETPARKANWLKLPKRRAIYLGLTVIGLSWLVSAQMFTNRHQLSLSVTSNGWMWYPYAYEEPNRPDASEQLLRGRQIFVIGNSHTVAYEAMISLLEQRQGIKATLMPTGQCSVGNLHYPVKDIPGCETLIKDYLDRILQQSQPGDLVMFASLRAHRFTDQWERRDPQQVLKKATSPSESERVVAARLETLPILRELQNKGLFVLFDAPKPVLLGPAYRCSDWFNKHNPICDGGFAISEPLMRQLREPVMQSMAQVADDFSNVRLWDPLPYLCHSGQCAPFDKDGQPLFLDGDHLSGHGNRVLYPSFEATVLDIYNQPTVK